MDETMIGDHMKRHSGMNDSHIAIKMANAELEKHRLMGYTDQEIVKVISMQLMDHGVSNERIEQFWDERGLLYHYRIFRDEYKLKRGMFPFGEELTDVGGNFESEEIDNNQFEGDNENLRGPIGTKTASFWMGSDLHSLKGKSHFVMSPDSETEKFLKKYPHYVIIGAEVVGGSNTFSIPLSITARQEKKTGFIGEPIHDQYILNPRQPSHPYKSELVQKDSQIPLPNQLEGFDKEDDLLNEFVEKLHSGVELKGRTTKREKWRVKCSNPLGQYIHAYASHYPGIEVDDAGYIELDPPTFRNFASSIIKSNSPKTASLRCKNFKIVAKPAFPNDSSQVSSEPPSFGNDVKKNSKSHTSFGLRHGSRETESNGKVNIKGSLSNDLFEGNTWINHSSIKSCLTAGNHRDGISQEVNSERSAFVNAVLQYVDPTTIPQEPQEQYE